jgi:aromatic ring-opening dioxygenase catalytic subunit (LigB family)
MGKQADIAAWLGSYASTLPRQPTAILIVTAHWEARQTTVSAADSHGLLFDYGGFPPETYKYQYPAPGSPGLAERVHGLLAGANQRCGLDTKRGWDHGVFVPLMLMFPEARIPVVQLSVLQSQSAAAHIAVGEALQPLRDEGVLIIGSGASFHNFGYMFSKGKERERGIAHAAAWDAWLKETVAIADIGERERCTRLASWESAPSAREAHPQGAAEHLVPLFTVFGAAGAGPAGRIVGERQGADFRSSQFEFS